MLCLLLLWNRQGAEEEKKKKNRKSESGGNGERARLDRESDQKNERRVRCTHARPSVFQLSVTRDSHSIKTKTFLTDDEKDPKVEVARPLHHNVHDDDEWKVRTKAKQ